MSAFDPLRIETLLAWALAGLERDRSVFGLPRRSFWHPKDGFDLSAPVVGGRAETPLGPAAGPHTQLAQNIVVAWLAGARVLELKTVQVIDRLEIARPCIDAPAEGYNVEWSQELPIAQSLEQYVSAWLLVHVLAARGMAGPEAERSVRAGRGLPGTRFDASVGYDLAGLRSESVARFLDGLGDATEALAALRWRLPLALLAAGEVPAPSRVADTVTLSTFHGCPPEEIEAMVEHLFARHAMNVVVKLNPTLLGYEHVAHLLHDVAGRRDIALERDAFEKNLQFEYAVAMLARLSIAARRRGLALGIKLTNTLVVRNTRGRLAGERIYLSGAPLHPIAIALAEQLAGSEAGELPRSFSAGVNAENFSDTVACGFAPVTTCTDLLHPTGYRRLPRYLKALEAELERTGSRNLAEYATARAREGGKGAAGEPVVRNLAAYRARLAAAPHAESPAPAPPLRLALRFLDCDACNRCTLVCPNGAFFSVATSPMRIATREFAVAEAQLVTRPAVFETRCERQWLLDAGLCNDCGNCDTWCPEAGGPNRVKPRLHRNRESYVRAAPADGILIEAGGEKVAARFGGIEHRLERQGHHWLFANDAIEALLEDGGAVRDVSLMAAREGRRLDLTRFHALRMITAAVQREVNPIWASLRIEHAGQP